MAASSGIIRAALGSHAPRDKEQHPASPKSESKHTAEPVYGWFTEGFDTRDLREAKVLLEELASKGLRAR